MLSCKVRGKSLKDHLTLYGIRHFASDAYWEWAARELGEERARWLDDLRAGITGPGFKKNPEKIRRFYDAVSDPAVASVIHSMKADAIRASGTAVGHRLRKRKHILDLGCGLGYLTTWYARQNPRSAVYGVDFSGASIREAVEKAGAIGLENVHFAEADISKTFLAAFDGRKDFDAIVDTQTIQAASHSGPVFRKVRDLLKKDGIFISIPALETARHAESFLKAMKREGFKIFSFDFIYYSDCGCPGAYPVITAGSSGECREVDVRGGYEKAWQLIQKMKDERRARWAGNIG